MRSWDKIVENQQKEGEISSKALENMQSLTAGVVSVGHLKA
jgi:hypothetical protein